MAPKWDQHIKLITFALLSQAVFDHFGTFPVGWVGGWGKSRLKTISAQLKLKLGLSLAKMYYGLSFEGVKNLSCLISTDAQS